MQYTEQGTAHVSHSMRKTASSQPSKRRVLQRYCRLQEHQFSSEHVRVLKASHLLHAHLHRFQVPVRQGH